jgi:putative transcriptional regulator
MTSLAGSFLIASPKVIAPAFHRSVVLLLRHDAQGAFGLVVNRPGTDRKGLPFVVFNGGPCEAQGLLLLHGHPEWQEAFPGTVVTPEIFVGDFACLKKVSDAPEAGYRFRAFIGFAGWGAGQLESEVADCAWTVAPATGELMFDSPVEELWSVLRPPKLPVPGRN